MMRMARSALSATAVNAMLLNEFLKNHRTDQDQARKLQEQEATIAQLKASVMQQQKQIEALTATVQDRKSTRLNSSHLGISYAVFCLKKKKKTSAEKKHGYKSAVRSATTLVCRGD